MSVFELMATRTSGPSVALTGSDYDALLVHGRIEAAAMEAALEGEVDG